MEPNFFLWNNNGNRYKLHLGHSHSQGNQEEVEYYQYICIQQIVGKKETLKRIGIYHKR